MAVAQHITAGVNETGETSPHLLVRVGCLLLAAVSAELGVWAAFFPRHFFFHFPGSGRAWVSADGPYNQHLVRDFGQYNLAFAILLIGAAVLASTQVRRLVLVAYVVQAVPHLVYHARHLSIYRSSDQVLNMVSLGLNVALPLVLLVIEPQLSRRPNRSTTS
jgi:hypothetical protein